jgi:ABC-2 type transport system ATP-binding protein
MIRPADAPAVELRDVGKTYGRGDGATRAVADVSLTVGRGEVYGFLGPNGAGKSTTIRMMLGLIRPSAGKVLLFGEDVQHRTSLHRVGSLVDGGAFYPFLSGRQNLKVLARTQGHSGERIEPLLDRVGLGPDAHRKVKGYSLGMRQRLGVAAALLNDPELVILDEPVNGLDVTGILEMRALIRTLADEGKTVFLSSHLLHEVEQVCDRVAIIGKGRLIREDSIAELLRSEQAMMLEAEPVDAAIAALTGRWTAAATPAGIRIVASRADVPAILRALIERGVDVFRIAGEEQNLEDAFLAITQGGREHADV